MYSLFRNADGRQTRNLYRLYSVLVHSGGVHGGHYYAYIRPNPCVAGDGTSEWFRFDDEKVTKEERKMILTPRDGYRSPLLHRHFGRATNERRPYHCH